MLEKYPGLIEVVRRNEVVPFIGAGFSKRVGLPDGRQLARLISDRVHYPSTEDPLPIVAQYYFRQNGKPNLIRLMREVLSVRRGSDFINQRLLESLPWRMAVTTNYDDAIEQVVQDNFEIIITDDDIPVTDFRRRVLIKLYGCLRQPTSILITEEDLSNFTKRRPGIKDVLSPWFKKRPFLFLGYSLQDSNFGYLYRHSTEHLGELRQVSYAVQKRPDNMSEYEWTSTIVNPWWDKGIIIIDADVTAFLEELITIVGMSRTEIERRIGEELRREKSYDNFVRKKPSLQELASAFELYVLKDAVKIEIQDDGSAWVQDILTVEKKVSEEYGKDYDTVYLGMWCCPDCDHEITRDELQLKATTKSGKECGIEFIIDERTMKSFRVAFDRKLRLGEKEELKVRLYQPQLFSLSDPCDFYSTVYDYPTEKAHIQIQCPSGRKPSNLLLMYEDTGDLVEEGLRKLKVVKRANDTYDILCDLNNPYVGRTYYLRWDW